MKPEHLHKYSGNLELYFETGMEQMGTIFHDDRGLHEGPKYDNPEEKMMYKSLAWSLWFGARFCIYNAKIFNPDGSIAFEGPLVKDKVKMKRAKYEVSFIPTMLDRKAWIRFCQMELRAEIETNELCSALKEQYKVEFETGTTVLDTVSNMNAVVIGHILKPMSSDFKYLTAIIEDGKLPKMYQERAPSELAAIKWPGMIR